MRIFRREPQAGEPLTPKEFERIVSERTRYYFNMTVDEFRSALREGRLEENLAATDIALLLGETTR